MNFSILRQFKNGTKPVQVTSRETKIDKICGGPRTVSPPLEID